MKKYQTLEMQLHLFAKEDIITTSGEDGAPIEAQENEGLWNDFY